VNIFLIDDGVQGHLNQSTALCEQLCKELSQDYELISIHDDLPPLKSEDKNYFIGAGNKVHKKLIEIKKKYSDAFVIAILRPSFFISKFDLILAPNHDFIYKKIPQNCITYEGALCKTYLEETDNDIHLIALGGTNKNVLFSIEILLKNIEYLSLIFQNKQLYIANSRRTSKEIWNTIKSQYKDVQNINLVDVNSTNTNEFVKILRNASKRFITPDSFNLIFESLSVSGKTYILQTAINKKLRSFFLLNKHKFVVDKLIKEKKAGFVYADISLGMKNMLHKLIEPLDGHEPFAEVEKVVYQIKRFFNNA